MSDKHWPKRPHRRKQLVYTYPWMSFGLMFLFYGFLPFIHFIGRGDGYSLFCCIVLWRAGIELCCYRKENWV